MSKILLVDDSAMTRKFYALILSSIGYEVTEAEDGYIALEHILAESYDLVITDVNMPRMDGFNFINEVRSTETGKKTPIIIITTLEHLADIKHGAELGANLYYIKPVQPEELVQGVRRLLA